MKPGKVRPIAICVFRRSGRILVAEGYDEIKRQVFYRPLGGKIEFGERGEETILRELREELNLETIHLRYLGTFENIFTYNGKMGHEIVLVYDGEFVDSQVYNQEQITGREEEGIPIKAIWKSLDDFYAVPDSIEEPLYPTGLLELLRETA